MSLSFFAYIDESKDDRYPASKVIGLDECIPKGTKRTLSEAFGKVTIIGLGEISYQDDADLHGKVCALLRGMEL